VPSGIGGTTTRGRGAAADRYVALVRGINVGRAKRVAMADLRSLFECLGHRDVRTLLNSGNVVFTGSHGAARAASRIERAMAGRLGVSARVAVLSAAELGRIVTENPLLKIAKDPSRLLVAVLLDPADRRRLQPLLDQDWRPDVLAVGSRAAYMWCPRGMLGSRLPDEIGRRLGDAVTTRNWATISKLHTLAAAPVASGP
jgi:uncharacterized protein (DUF1697 family)